MQAFTEQLIPVAILTNVLWGYGNLTSETKNNQEKGFMWGLAFVQLLMIGLALFIPKKSNVMFWVMLILSVVAGFLTWGRFESSKTLMILYLITQALANSLYIIHYTMTYFVERRKIKLQETRIQLDVVEQNIAAVKKGIEAVKKERQPLDNVVVFDKNQREKFDELNRDLKIRDSKLQALQKERLALKNISESNSADGMELTDFSSKENETGSEKSRDIAGEIWKQRANKIAENNKTDRDKFDEIWKQRANKMAENNKTDLDKFDERVKSELLRSLTESLDENLFDESPRRPRKTKTD